MYDIFMSKLSNVFNKNECGKIIAMLVSII